jgi:protein-L-isoaspartate O-methyltransferase
MDLKRFVPQHSGASSEMAMEQYYQERALEYDQIYQLARRQNELLQLKTWLTERVRGRTILEIAAGTGYWTEAAASVAKAITATDCNSELLQIASKRSLGPHVTLRYADAYSHPISRIPSMPEWRCRGGRTLKNNDIGNSWTTSRVGSGRAHWF